MGIGLFVFYQTSKQNTQNSEITKLQEEVYALLNPKPHLEFHPTVAVTPKTQQQAPDLASIVKEWRPRIAHVSCEWRYVDDGVAYLWDSGSGLLANVTDTKAGNLMVILTNRHVLQPIENKDTPYSCDISLPDVTSPLKVIDTGALYSFRWSSQGLDYGDIVLYYPTDYMKNLASQNLSICRGKPSVGDELVILGYPSIGSQTDITATEGIISGYDGDYYITSAKVEHGNSGGAAILVKDDCYLGIPSFVDVGTVESLARILSAGAIFGGI